MVNLHRGFGGQNRGLNPGKFKNAELHQGLSEPVGDLLILDVSNIGRPIIRLIVKSNVVRV